MRIMVTGGAGYIGSVICGHLLTHGHEVIVFDDLSRGHAAAVAPQATLVLGDVRDTASLTAALMAHRCTAVVHMAAVAEVAESVRLPQLYHEVNTEGTRSLLTAALHTGVRRIVFSSTAAVYGTPDHVPIPETAPLRPQNPYGASKLAAERLLFAGVERVLSEQHLTVVALRYFNACGAQGGHGEDHEPETHLIPLALRAARDGSRLSVFGDDYPTADGTCVRDYVHVADLAEAHALALDQEDIPSSAINLGTSTGASVREVLDTVGRVTGRPVAHTVEPRRPGDPAVLVATNARAADVLGWQPRRSLTDAVRDAWDWMCAHPAGYED